MGYAPFDNKVIVITGAASGLGRRLAVNLAHRAKKLIIIDKIEKETTELCDELKQKNADIDKYIFDFNHTDELGQEIDNVYKNYDRIDVVFNVAGMENTGYVDDLDVDIIQEVINVNLLAPFLFSKKVIPIMKKQKSGQIITIASDMGKRSIPGRSPYCMSKFAVVALVEAMRLELQPYNIDAITVFPGLMQTTFWNKIKCFGRIDMEYLKNRSRMQDPDLVAKRIIKQIEHRKLILSKFSPMKIFLLLNYICPAFGDFIIRNCINLKKAKM